MTSNNEALKDQLKSWTLFLGVLQITIGCMIGFIPPSAVEWFRGIVMAHIEFAINGILMIVFAYLISTLRLNSLTLKIWFATLQIGTWSNGTAGLVAAFTGASSKLMPTLNEKFPPPNGIDSQIVSGLLMLCGITILLTLFITLYGLLPVKRNIENKAKTTPD